MRLPLLRSGFLPSRACTEHTGIVATVGFVEARPGDERDCWRSGATLDIRHASDGARTEALDELIRHAESIAARAA